MKVRRTKSAPSVEDTFLVRICKALDEPPRMLAINLGVPYSELEPMLGDRRTVAEMDRDEVWWKLTEHVSRRLGELMAAKYELEKALQKDRAKRTVRVAQQMQMKRGAPSRVAD